MEAQGSQYDLCKGSLEGTRMLSTAHKMIVVQDKKEAS